MWKRAVDGLPDRSGTVAVKRYHSTETQWLYFNKDTERFYPTNGIFKNIGIPSREIEKWHDMPEQDDQERLELAKKTLDANPQNFYEIGSSLNSLIATVRKAIKESENGGVIQDETRRGLILTVATLDRLSENVVNLRNKLVQGEADEEHLS